MARKMFQIILLIISYLIAILFCCLKVKQRGELEFGGSTDKAISVQTNSVIEFDIPNTIDISSLYGVEVTIGTYGKIIDDGSLLIEIIDKKSNHILAETNIDLEGTSDGTKRVGEFKNTIQDSQNAYVRITGLNLEDNPIALWVDESKNSEIKYDNTMIEGAIYLSLLYFGKDKIYVYESLLIALVLSIKFALPNLDEKEDI